MVKGLEVNVVSEKCLDLHDMTQQIMGVVIVRVIESQFLMLSRP